MGIASLIIGIVSLIIGFIPGCGIIAVLPALVGLGLGIADVVVKSKKEQPKGMAIAGIVLSVVAVLVIVIWTTVIMSSIPFYMEDITLY